MKAYQKAQKVWFGRGLTEPDKEKASGRQPRSLIKQRLHANNTIRLSRQLTHLSKRVSPPTISGLVSEYKSDHFKRFGVRTPLPEDVFVCRGYV